MREIKFKAYLKDFDLIAEVEFINLKHNEILAKVEGELFEFHLGEYELMQYTGLKDKNGKEIYEGDIILWDEKEFGRPFKELVKWDYEQFSARLRDWGQHCEVIGNIYEHSHLLKEEVK